MLTTDADGSRAAARADRRRPRGQQGQAWLWQRQQVLGGRLARYLGTGLDGAERDVEAFRQSYRPMHQRYLQHKRISYAFLAVCTVAYTIFLLR